MTTAEPNWDLYRSFLSVLKEGSLSGAARTLTLTQPTVGRHIDALEQALGLALFTRSQTGFIPTEAAYELEPYAATLAATSSALLRAASSMGRDGEQGIHGTVRITASEVVSVEVLPALLAKLSRSHPHIQIELAVSNKLENLLRRDADIAIRMTKPEHEALIARRIGNIELGFFAHRSYLKRRGTPLKWEELAGHTLIGVDSETAYTRAMRARFNAPPHEAHQLRCDNDVVQLAAIRAGVGIGICQAALGQAHGSLVRVLPDQLSIQLDTWLAMHENLRNNPACSAVFSALAAGLSAYVDSQGGLL
ncbi:MAG: LysR family transcriptional regulator [Pseudomonadota bacterium]